MSMAATRRQPGFLLFTVGVLTGAVAAWAFLKQRRKREEKDLPKEKKKLRRFGSTPTLIHAEERRERLPSYIILVRHGESEGNADVSLYRTKPDNLVNLTDRGVRQAEEAGMHIENKIFQQAPKLASESDTVEEIKRIHLIVSPFERTLQTAAAMRKYFEHRVVRTDIQPRIREQEFGNLQGDDFKSLREEQKTVGRFWYRFPTGESGSDVYDRVKTWWYESVLSVNERVGYDRVEGLVVVTHGLTMRFALMQLYNWSPNTFHAVWNAGNCDVYVLRKDLSKPGMSPYVLDDDLGNTLKSSIDLIVEVKNNSGGDHNSTTTHVLTLEDYLSIPPPRTTRLDLIKNMLVEQHPEVIASEYDILSVETKSWMHGALNKGRSIKNPDEKELVTEIAQFHSAKQRPSRESSGRFPNSPCTDPAEPQN
jgi:broad specificity phosphatase PhoE